jgi:FtsP/CotA-like multicopper oxidase with cupredoxin domain
MYHCHVEDVEHVQMGMTGLVFIRPLQDKYGYAGAATASRNGGNPTGPCQGYMYNDGNGSTAFDREFAMFMSEVWAEAHWADAHIQLPEWSDYRADFSLLNGRVYPDTIEPSAPTPDGFDPSTWNKPFLPVKTDVDGNLVAPDGRPDLQYQPLSSLVKCNAGDRVAMRFSNLGFKEAAMTLPGIPMKVVGKDATPMLGRDNTDTSYSTDTLSLGAGESFDVIFVAPPFSGDPAGYDTYMLFDRAYTRANNLATGGFGSRATEIRVYAANTLPAQSIPNT